MTVTVSSDSAGGERRFEVPVGIPIIHEPPAPDRGIVLYVDAADSVLKSKDSSGTVAPVGSAGPLPGNVALKDATNTFTLDQTFEGSVTIESPLLVDDVIQSVHPLVPIEIGGIGINQPLTLDGHSAPRINNSSYQNFLVIISKPVAGATRMAIAGDIASVSSAWAFALNFPSSAPHALPLVDNTHGFANGGGILNATKNILLFDTLRAQSAFGPTAQGMVIRERSVGVDAQCDLFWQSDNINGSSLQRLSFVFFDSTGAALDLTTLPDNSLLAFRFVGYLDF